MVERFPTTAQADAEITTLTYGFFSSGAGSARVPLQDIARIEVAVEAESESENGPSGPGNLRRSVELYDRAGRNTFSIAADGAVTRRFFTIGHGMPTAVVANVNTDTGASGNESFRLPTDSAYSLSFTRPADRFADGGALRTEYVYDPLARLVATVEPSGATTRWRRILRDIDSRPLLSYAATETLPHKDSASPPTIFGPASVVWESAAGTTIGRDEFQITDYTLGTGSSGYVPHVASVTQPTQPVRLSKVRLVQSVSGLPTETRHWHNVADSSASGYYATKRTYDAKGRNVSETSPTGTVRSMEYDVRDRVVSESVGTATSTQVKVLDRVYDGQPGSAVSGVGNGNLTLERRYVSASVYRDTKRTYDGRDRLIAVAHPTAPHEFMVRDNLGRVTEMGLFSAETSTMTATGRERYVVTAYGQRGAPYRRFIAIDPSASGALTTSNSLSLNVWYDAAGRPIEVWGPNGPAIKTVYDGLGRAVKEYRTDRGGDAAPGASGNYADASSLSGDTVFEQMEDAYAAGSMTGTATDAGLLTLSATRRRGPATGTGALAANTSGVVTTWLGFVYDAAERIIKEADFGTNSSNDLFEQVTTAPSLSSLSLALVTQTQYGVRGLPEVVTDATDLKTKFFYDDLDRRIATIENWKDASISRTTDTDKPWGWKIVDSTPLKADEDKATISAYNGDDAVTDLVAVNILSTTHDYQRTRYVYGVTPTGQTPPTDGVSGSELSSNSLLARTIYPDFSGSADTVTNTYNRLGELATTTDQRGVTRAFDRDARGRVTKDAATLPQGTAVDAAITVIEATYDNLGRLKDARSKGGQSLSVRNAIGFRYSKLGQITEVIQNPIGDINETTPPSSQGTTNLSYATSAAGNYSRRETLSYPTSSAGMAVAFAYGSSGTGDDRASRITTMSWPGPNATSQAPHTAEYRYSGSRGIVSKRFAKPSLLLSRELNPSDGGASNANVFPGLDRYGRIKRQLWVPTDSSGAWSARTADGSAGRYAPALVDLGYTYDKADNPTARLDRRADNRSIAADRDETYVHDGLHRLTEAKRGTWNHATSNPALAAPAGLNGGQQWDLDALGNWAATRIDSNGDASFTSASDISEARAVNSANEISTRSITDPGLGLSAAAAAPGYDAAGNMNSRPTPVSGGTAAWTLVYDAWNRLVRVDVAGVARAAYTYNALHQRVTRLADTNPETNTAIDEANLFYYDASWRLIEERVHLGYSGGLNGGLVDGSSFTCNRLTQRVWGLGYIDELVYFHTDATPSDGDLSNASGYYALVDRLYSVIAVTSVTGALQERIRYSAYGVPTALDEGTAITKGDVNRDGSINFTDLSTVLGAYGAGLSTTSSAYTPEMDVSASGSIDFADQNAVLNGYGQSYTYRWENKQSLQTVGNTVGYCGYLADPATGLWLARYRWQDPSLGRWASRDPIGYLDGMNFYEYVGGMPLCYVDPLGLSWADYLPSWTIDAGNWGAGFGDDITFGATNLIRNATGLNSAVDKSSDAYMFGELTGMAASTLAGLGAGVLKAGAKEAGKEFSHFVARRIIGDPKGRRYYSVLNGNYVSTLRHYRHDPRRHLTLEKWGQLPPRYGRLRKWWDRAPYVWKGVIGGGLWGLGWPIISPTPKRPCP